MSVTAIILAAGKGTRMRSDLPKVLHEACGRAMVSHVVAACRAAGVGRVVVVVGHGADLVRQRLAAEHASLGEVDFALQAEQRGTGHAVACCEAQLAQADGPVLVLTGDAPLIRASVLQGLLASHAKAQAAATLATAMLDDPTGYGRILRRADGSLLGIVEQADCSADQRAIREVNPSYYCFDAAALRWALPQLSPANAKGELYLTDVIGLMVADGRHVQALPNVPAEDVLGVNDRAQLATVGQILQRRLQAELMLSGVTIVDPSSTWVEAGAQVGVDSVLLPFTYVGAGARLGQRCRVGPHGHVPAGTQLPDDAVAEGVSWRAPR